ncbi:MAG: SDR family oxidoreductase [Saonia sp.]
MNSTIGILGCGWLGLPLAQSLLTEGYRVHGSTTSPEKLNLLKTMGIQAFLVSLGPDTVTGDIPAFLSTVDILIINVPPKLRGGNTASFIKKMQRLLDVIKASDIKKIVFVSSTSVYGEIEGELTESTVPLPGTESGKQLLASEGLFANDDQLQTTIIRFGGLIGPTRHPITHLSGKKQLPNGNAYINLIHLEDCIRIITAIVTEGWWNELFNGVYPHHPTKKEYYTLEAQKRELLPPEYLPNDREMGKKIISNRLINVKKFDFTTSIQS